MNESRQPQPQYLPEAYRTLNAVHAGTANLRFVMLGAFIVVNASLGGAYGYILTRSSSSVTWDIFLMVIIVIGGMFMNYQFKQMEERTIALHKDCMKCGEKIEQLLTLPGEASIYTFLKRASGLGDSNEEVAGSSIKPGHGQLLRNTYGTVFWAWPILTVITVLLAWYLGLSSAKKAPIEVMEKQEVQRMIKQLQETSTALETRLEKRIDLLEDKMDKLGLQKEQKRR